MHHGSWCIAAGNVQNKTHDLIYHNYPLSSFSFFLSYKRGITSPGPQLRPIDKGDKEVIKFCRLWQASDKAEFCHCYVDTSQVSTKEWEHYKSDKDFSRMRSLHHFTFCHISVIIRFSYVTLLCHPCRWVVIGALN